MAKHSEQNPKTFAKSKKSPRYFDINKSDEEISLENKSVNKDKICGEHPGTFPKSKKSPRYFDIKKSDEEILLENKSEGSLNKVIKVRNVEKKFINFKRPYHKKNAIKDSVDPKFFQKHSRGAPTEYIGVKTDFFKTKLKKKEIYLEYATEQAAKTEILLTEEHGFLEPHYEERTLDFRQEDIVKNVDITAAAKYFKLNLEFGPYHHRYTKNGRHLLLGGRKGHVAAFDWITKKLHCEINVMEEIKDISWLHVEDMFAVAQKNWTYFYDKKGTEIHCVKRLSYVNKMEFLPYHFLLATCSSTGYLSWLDITLGEIIGQYNSKLGDIQLMCHNPINGVLCIGGGKGVVTMWTPKVKEPVLKLVTHASPMTDLTVDPKGIHLITAGLDRKVMVWDVRSLGKPLDSYILRMPANHLSVSQKGMLSISMGNSVEIYKSCLINENSSPYLRQRVDSYVHNLRFCPFEDLLGISHEKGFLSMLVPGSGEPNFDSYEANPFQTKSQRRENEVRAILEKIPAELISLDPDEICGVDVEKLEDKVNEKKNLFFVKAPKINFTSRRKMKGKGGSAKASRNKQIVKDMRRKEFMDNLRSKKNIIIREHGVRIATNETITENPTIMESSTQMETASVLDRFKVKKK